MSAKSNKRGGFSLSIRTKIKNWSSIKKKIFNELVSSGFNDLEYSKNQIKVESTSIPNYSVVIEHDGMRLISDAKSLRDKIVLIHDILLLLNTISPFCSFVYSDILSELEAVLPDIADALSVAPEARQVEFDKMKKKYEVLERKYRDLVASSEQNARLLLECERKNEELNKRFESIMKLTDKALMYEIYKWLKVHGGYINYTAFCKAYNVPQSRVESAVQRLKKEGYIEEVSD